MSIATLKKKTQAKYNNMSVGMDNFSLNGTHRSQGWVGQTMLSRSLPRTPMKGNTPKGNGGCCGKYNTKPGIIQSGVYYLNNPTVIKPSVITNKGMLEEKLTPYHNYLTVKPDATLNSNNMSEYTENLAIENIKIVAIDCSSNVITYCKKPHYDAYFRGDVCDTVKPPLDIKLPLLKKFPMLMSDYLAKKDGVALTCPNSNTLTIRKPTNGGVLPGPAASY